MDTVTSAPTKKPKRRRNRRRKSKSTSDDVDESQSEVIRDLLSEVTEPRPYGVFQLLGESAPTYLVDYAMINVWASDSFAVPATPYT